MSNVITEDAISGNITDTISDHLGQFLILPHNSSHKTQNKKFSKNKLKISVRTIFFQTTKK